MLTTEHKNPPHPLLWDYVGLLVGVAVQQALFPKLRCFSSITVTVFANNILYVMENEFEWKLVLVVAKQSFWYCPSSLLTHTYPFFKFLKSRNGEKRQWLLEVQPPTCWQVTADFAALHVFVTAANPSRLKQFIIPLPFCKPPIGSRQSILCFHQHWGSCTEPAAHSQRCHQPHSLWHTGDIQWQKHLALQPTEDWGASPSQVEAFWSRWGAGMEKYAIMLSFVIFLWGRGKL